MTQGSAKGEMNKTRYPPIKTIGNMRDLHSANPAIQPGKIFRCANPASASPEDVELLKSDYGILELIDLRSDTEMADDANSKLFSNSSYQVYTRSILGEFGDLQAPKEGIPATKFVRYHLSMLERKRYGVYLVKKLPISTLAKTCALQLWDRKASKQKIMQEVNQGGLPLLYQILLESAQQEICQVLQLVLNAAERNRPLMFYCRAGKDRTGLIAMFILTCSGATRDQILDDYIKSDEHHKVGLAGMENSAAELGLDLSVFERAPREAMEVTLDFIDTQWGSRQAYMASIGFGPIEQQRLKMALIVGEASQISAEL